MTDHRDRYGWAPPDAWRAWTPTATNSAVHAIPDETSVVPVFTLPVVPDLYDEPSAPPPPPQRPPGLVRLAGQVAVGTLMSRLTGFVRTIVLAAVLGDTLVNSAYNVANTLPNIVYELLLGGVLTSVIVPLLVRSQKDAEAKGADPNTYAQRLLTLGVVGLTGATAIGVIMAPLLVQVQGIHSGDTNHAVGSWLAALLLPEMIFYGIGALAGAILNTRDDYRAAAWAPVLNNVVVIAVGFGLWFLRHKALASVSNFSSTDILILGIGTTLGIVVQALALIPALRRVGFRWKWRWGVRGTGLGELRGLALWVFGYVLLGQVGFTVASNVANQTVGEQYNQLVYAALLFQLPYGILGVSLLTAIMPKLARAAADGDWPGVKSLLRRGTRLTGVALIPVSAAFLFLSVPLTLLFFRHGSFTAAASRDVGLILAASVFGLFPYAVTLLQLRIFYAAKDAKTPTMLMGVIVSVRVVLSLACLTLPHNGILIGLAVANSVAFVVGAVVGDVVLRRRHGHLGSGRVLAELLRTCAAAAVSLVVAVPVFLWCSSVIGAAGVWSWAGLTGAHLLHASSLGLIFALVVPSLVGLGVFVVAAYILGVAEIKSGVSGVMRRIRH